MKNQNFFTISEFCQYMNIGKNTAYNLIKTNEVKAFKTQRNWRISRQSVDDYIHKKMGEVDSPDQIKTLNDLVQYAEAHNLFTPTPTNK